MTERPDAPPEGVLIKAALAAFPTRLSQREAAHRAGISEARWRQIVSGYQAVSGRKVPVRGPDGTLARMAYAVGVSPEQLDAAGRDGAAAVLRDTAAAAQQQAAGDGPSGGSDARSRVEERWHMLEAVLDQARIGLSPAEYGTLVGRINVYFAQDPQWRPLDEGPRPAGRRAEEPPGPDAPDAPDRRRGRMR